jgi:hypothetical protein
MGEGSGELGWFVILKKDDKGTDNVVKKDYL